MRISAWWFGIVAGCFPEFPDRTFPGSEPGPSGDDDDDIVDADEDGFAPPEDCDDGDEGVYPGAPETCANTVDEDCDGVDPRCLPTGVVGVRDVAAVIVGGAWIVDTSGDIDGDGVDELTMPTFVVNAAWQLGSVAEDRIVPVASGEVAAGYQGWVTASAAGSVAGGPEADLVLGLAGRVDLVLDPGSNDPPGVVHLLTNEDLGLGYDVAIVPDTNGDGVADLWLGLSGPSNAGSAMLIDPAGLVAGTTSNVEDHLVARVQVPDAGGAFGGTVAGGDLDGNGLAELTVGVSSDDATGGAFDAMGVFVYEDGLDTDQMGSLVDQLGLLFSVRGDEPGFWPGQRAIPADATVADLDGDGLGDLIAAMTFDEGDRGQLLIVRGRSTEFVPDTRESDVEAAVYGPEAGIGFATTVVSLGDFDGDGVDDVATGAWTAAGGDGRVYVLSGASVAGTVDLAESAALLTLEGTPGSGRQFGTTLAAGDFDGDGFGDLAASDAGRDFEHAVYVVFGGLAL